MILFLRNTLFLMAAAILPFSACTQSKQNHPKCEDASFDSMLEQLLRFSVPVISCNELHKNRSSYLVLDTREWKEFNVSHIPGARFAGYNSFDWNVLSKVPKNSPIVVYCSVGYRSEKIGEKIIAAGYTNVKNLYGSIFEWANIGLPLEDNSGKAVAKLHTYNKDWGRWIKKKSVIKVN